MSNFSKRKAAKLAAVAPWRVGLVLLLLVLAVAAGLRLHQWLWLQPAKDNLVQATQARAERHQRLLNDYLEARTAAVARLAADADTQTALAGQEEANPSVWQQTAAKTLPEDARIHLVAPGKPPPALTDAFAALALARQAMAGETPPPQAARTDRWYLQIARPVDAGEQVAGALLAELPLTDLRRHLLSAGSLEGTLSLLQTVPGNPPVRLLTLGDNGDESAHVSIPAGPPEWRLVYSPGPALARQSRPSPWPLALALLAAGATFLGLAYGVLRMQVRLPGRKSPQPDDGEPMPSADFNAPRTAKPVKEFQLPDHVFRDYDIRGRAGTEISPHFAQELGKVLGSMALENGEHTLAVAADGRLSSPELSRALMDGILATGCDLINLGRAPTPLLNFALNTLAETDSGVMVTASHNPASDNGFKIVFRGHALSNDEIRNLKTRMAAKEHRRGQGEERSADLRDDYINAVTERVEPASGLRVAVDCGHGIAGELAPHLLEGLGCAVVPLNCDVDGNFPDHDPDPTVAANLQSLIDTVKHTEADLGLALDGDGDRLVAVTGAGRIVWPDELLMIFARDVVARSPGADVIFDVKSTRRLHGLISSYGGRPVMWKTGHAHMRNKMAETQAPVGGEFSGHLFFNDRWYGFDDGLYAAARLLEIITFREQNLDDIVEGFPATVATAEIRVAVTEDRKFDLVAGLAEQGDFGEAKVIDIDGLRVEYTDGWGLVRASNTAAALTLRFEADSEEALTRIKTDIRKQLEQVDGSLPLDF